MGRGWASRTIAPSRCASMEIDYFCSRSLTLEPKMHWDLFKSTVIERCLTWDAMLLSAAPCRSEWDRRDICAISATRIDPGPVRSISKAESIKFTSGHSGSLTLARVFTGPESWSVRCGSYLYDTKQCTNYTLHLNVNPQGLNAHADLQYNVACSSVSPFTPAWGKS